MVRKIVLMSLILVAFSFITNAQTPEESPAKTWAWELGLNLSLATMKNAAGAPAAEIDESFAKAVLIAKKFGITLPPLPAQTIDRTESNQRLLDYLVDSTGKPIKKILEGKYGNEYAASFGIAQNTYILYWLYIYGDVEQIERLSATVIDIIRLQTILANLPAETTAEIVGLGGTKPVKDVVKKAIFASGEKVFKYLLKRDLIERADACAAQMKYAEAVAEYTKALRVDENFTEAYFKRATAYFRLAEYDLAIAD
jgi:hypothetical protein